MQFDIMKKAAIGSAVFSIAAMGIILYMSAEKVITISDVAQDEVQRNTSYVQQEGESGEQILMFASNEADTSYLRVPLPKECRAEDIIIENHYMNQELCILINGVEPVFFEENLISVNREMIRKGTCEEIEDGMKLRFRLTGIFEYRTILENNDLYVSFLRPKEMYDKIVVIDPACGGSNSGYAVDGLNEKEINLLIAQKLKEKLDKTDIKAYYTRMDDVNPTEEERVGLANGTRADMYIRIQADADEDSAIYGTTAVYNGDYFIPGFGSVELADLLEREVVTSIKGKALGLCEAEAQEYALRNVTIPAASIKTGCVTNKQEAILLERDDYQEKIAAGIYNAILKAYESGLKDA
ncbi:MAG: N-acetylmuramoyl-L-alanine amidase [Lachnospiraceae bacterium]|nr:N-acetylmuramoyl-L-alanine amidase [Lachnospiraceae bacterium]